MKKYLLLTILLGLFAAGKGQARQSAAEKEIIASMDDATSKWNKGDLDGYMALYDASATMMTSGGRVGIDSIRRIYVVHYFQDGQPKQQLAYANYQLTMLGKDYALLTGRFILKPNDKLPERHGAFSLTMVRRKDGWRILHDHSS
ncbi:MAG TPA: nuclear transport factor 2 family protein [Puia sp.]|jgi:ketosteroid isomerase-like protein|nr:nuclear transport factor 2 family protein [Puia sp.]